MTYDEIQSMRKGSLLRCLHNDHFYVVVGKEPNHLGVVLLRAKVEQRNHLHNYSTEYSWWLGPVGQPHNDVERVA